MNIEHAKAQIPRNVQDRRGLDFGRPEGSLASRRFVKRRKLHIDLISKSDWLKHRELLGSYQRAIDKSFLEIFGSK